MPTFTMTKLAAALVQNLKDLNAKERDHLMRFAYLGVTDAYEENTDIWLSKGMLDALKPQLAGTRLNSSKRCVFAAMDYHLDWFYAALVRTCKGEESGALKDDSPCEDDSLRPITGNQEDIDLLVVFADDEGNVVILCVEAKGAASFDKEQLARKVIRLDRILVASGAKGLLKCKLVLIAPEARRPAFKDCLTHARSLPEGDEVHDMRDCLANLATDIGRDEQFFVELKGFPKKLKKVTRTGPDDTGEKRTYAGWEITPR